MNTLEKTGLTDTPETALLVKQVAHDQRQFLHLLLSSADPTWMNLDLPMGQLKALAMVSYRGPLPIGRLGSILGIGKPAATLLVDALVRRELVARSEDSDDRRRTLVQLSARGRTLMDELHLGRECSENRFLEWLEQLQEGDLSALARGLRALVAVASADSRARIT